jgi:hypothetical protein
VQLFSKQLPLSYSSQEQDSKLDIPTTPYDNAKELKTPPNGRIMPWIHQHTTQARLGSLLQLLLLVLVVGLWGLHFYASYEVR